ncbi:MAG: lipase maturation factor family protein [Myxococcota bacterium]|nr:lipase maturation factor family protein [Myxococcota bacterium]
MSRYELMRSVFLRALGIVYAVAFASLAVQIVGLVGESGILPAAEYLESARRGEGARAYRLLPTLCWLSASDGFLLALAWGGVGLSLLLIAGIAPMLCLLLLWLFYLSLTVVGQVFLHFQWDTLLLETGLLAALFAPTTLGRGGLAEQRVSDLVRWLLWLLLFKLMFLSGITKLVSADPTWVNGSALAFHYETQPLPSWTSWYAHQLPAAIQLGSLAFMWLAELVAPFAIFAPARHRWLRRAGCAVMVSFQLAIAATGNYGFFNGLTIVLCLSLLDDDVWRWLLPARFGARRSHDPGPAPRWATDLRVVAAIVLVPLSALAFAREIAYTVPRAPGGSRPLAWSEPLVGWARPFRSVNGYGLFRTMSTERPEIAIEGRRAGGDWVEYRFRWKAGPPGEAPRFVAPHQPRLDWQMWFAALNPRRHENWLLPLAHRLLEGSREVRALLADGPFGDAPPDELRFVVYRYRFSRWGEPQADGAWWVREPLGALTGPISRQAFERAR